MKTEDSTRRARPLCTLELRTDGTVAAALPDFSVVKLPYEQCLAIQQVLYRYLKADEIAGFAQSRQLSLLDDERQAS